MRVHRPPAGTACSATTGTLATTTPSGVATVKVPTLAPAASGASSLLSSVVVVFSAGSLVATDGHEHVLCEADRRGGRGRQEHARRRPGHHHGP